MGAHADTDVYKSQRGVHRWSIAEAGDLEPETRLDANRPVTICGKISTRSDAVTHNCGTAVTPRPR